MGKGLTNGQPYGIIKKNEREDMQMEYKGFKVDDNKIDEYVEKLDLSITEACELILEEEGKIEEPKEVTEIIKETEKNAPRRYEKSAIDRKKAVKERKVDETKKKILNGVKALLEEMGAEVLEVKTETEIKMNYDGASYTLKLTKHRPPKK
jgi:hypothetical protein